MKHVEKVAICLAGGLTLHLGAGAVTSDTPGNPYLGIVDRNVFALKPIPVAPVEPDKTITPPQKIVLTGIVKAFGKKQVFFKTPMSAKPGEAPKDTSFMLSEGERAGEIEVVEINEAAGTVKFKNHGQPDDRSLEKDGMKPGGGGGGPAQMAGLPGGAAPNFGAPGGGVPAPSLTPVPTIGGGAATIQRPLRVTPAQPVSTPQGAVTPSQGLAIPLGGYSSTSPANNQQPKQEVLSPEEQIVHMEISRKLTEGQVARGEMPPLPPTPFTPGPPAPVPEPAGQ